MNGKTSATAQLQALRTKLDAAVNSRSELEEDFKSQYSVLIKFISKLSLVCKGMDIELDNRLANFRSLLSKSAPLVEIEQHINTVTKLIQKLTVKNEAKIREIHQQYVEAGKSLQSSKGLPSDLRRQLRSALKENENTKDALIEYVPVTSQLLDFYETVFNGKSEVPSGGLLNSVKAAEPASNTTEEVDPKIVEQFINILTNLKLSEEHNKQLENIKQNLNSSMAYQALHDSFLRTFNVIIEDLYEERETAETFLSTLNDTLSTMQTALKTTLSGAKKSASKHEQLNEKLHQHIDDMSGVVSSATSLSDVKKDINEKLTLIASALEEKTNFESAQQQSLEKQLKEMNTKVTQLEKQSASFEKRLQETQVKSMQDALTKLNNRAAFDDYFAKQMVRYHHEEFDLAIVILDLDDFKRINDTYGHTAGDKTLQVIANTLTKVIDKKAFIGRYGGEEFVLIFKDVNKTSLVSTLDSLRKHISRLPFKFKSNKVSITMSIGATHITKEDNIHIAFERADKALYQAKEKGKNRVIYQ